LQPAQEIEEKLAFEPSTVAERGWVVLFYCLTSASSAIQKQNPQLSTRLRWNIWTALDDASLFMEPSQVNVQALFSLAVHGETFATPSTSWALVTHVCRMVQAIGLHLPGDGHEGRLLLFWAIYAVDKSVSLAFGRPPMLPSHYYQDVPLPNLGSLEEYDPHVKKDEMGHQKEAVNFGAVHFLQCVQLSILTGRIQHFLFSIDTLDQESVTIEKDILESDLRNWYQRTVAVG
jgi:hypothetical protein